MQYYLTAELRSDLLKQAREGAPAEVCGFAYGMYSNHVVTFDWGLLIPNTATNPQRAFEIDGSVFRRAYERAQLFGSQFAIWHSHPDSPPTPSKEDFALISQLSIIPFIIVGVTVPVITIYERVELGRVREAYRASVKGL